LHCGVGPLRTMNAFKMGKGFFEHLTGTSAVIPGSIRNKL